MLLFESIEDRAVYYATKIVISTNALMDSAITRYIKYDILKMLAVDCVVFFLCERWGSEMHMHIHIYWPQMGASM